MNHQLADGRHMSRIAYRKIHLYLRWHQYVTSLCHTGFLFEQS